MTSVKRGVYLPGVLILIAIVSLVSAATAAGDVPRMSTDELKAMLGNPDVIILDVRTDSDWAGSDFRIPGAVRETKGDFKNWADKYPRDKTLVLYCA